MKYPVVSTKQGALKGKSAKNYLGERFYCFLGIPYAKPPIGDLRFKAPEPPEPWSGLLDARKGGPSCPSGYLINAFGKENNCLNLNIFTRTLPNENAELKPVMVWIHGGGWSVGSNRTDIYNPSYLMMEDIVLVTINYRLGHLGFLCIDDDECEVPGNAGLKDQVMALKWVQENIGNFNGDHNNVTIFGESAGGASVHYHVLSPLSKGLFHKAICQSGSSLNPWAQGIRGTDLICKIVGIKETNPKAILTQLKRLSAKKISMPRSKAVLEFRASERLFYGPVIEKDQPGAFLTESPENILKSGNYNKVPLIIGYTTGEGWLFEFCRKHAQAKLPKDMALEIDYSHEITKDENKLKEMCEKIKKYYYGDEEPTNTNLIKSVRLKSDTLFIYQIQKAIQLHKKTMHEPIYAYRMSIESSLNVIKKLFIAKSYKSFIVANFVSTKLNHGAIKSRMDKIADSFVGREDEGVSHADDLSYLFKTLLNSKLKPNSTEEIAMKRFVKLWTNFAKYGNPTPEDYKDSIVNVNWIPVNSSTSESEDINYLEIGETLSMGLNPDEKGIKFWNDLLAEYSANSNRILSQDASL